MTTKGWTSQELKVVTDDQTLWTVTEAARLLGPPELPVVTARYLVQLTGMEPQGKRRTTAYGRAGRYARVYRAQDFIEAYEALSQRA